MSVSIENVVFDLGGVILSWEPEKLIADVMQDPVLCQKVQADVIGHPDWLALDRGTLDRETAISRFSARTGIGKDLTQKMLDAVPESLVPIEATLALIDRIRNFGLPVYLLSNIGHWTLRRLLAMYDFWDIFNGRIFSCEIGMIKPEAEIYRYMLDTFCIKPEETVFIDDMAVNTEAAARMGIRTITFRDPAQLSAELSALGLLDRSSGIVTETAN